VVGTSVPGPWHRGGMGPGTDWQAWHRPYADPGSDLSRRRRAVQHQIEAWLDSREDESLRVVSACAGDGRDLLEVLARRPDGSRVTGRLLELDAGLASDAVAFATASGVAGIDVMCVDAGSAASYVGAVPADLVMMCGVFGNITDDDLRATLAALPSLCAPGATVIWTRGCFSGGDLSETIRGWFAAEGFDEIAYERPQDATYRVGAHLFAAEPRPLRPGDRLFSFTR
jgi:hypothetical protein